MVYEHVITVEEIEISSGGGGGRHCRLKIKMECKALNGRCKGGD
jgi:hypothetical protein